MFEKMLVGPGVSARHILFNFVEGADLDVIKPASVQEYKLHGKLLNRRWTVSYLGKGSPRKLQGQVFARYVDLKNMDLQCGGHFTGFAACQQLNLPVQGLN